VRGSGITGKVNPMARESVLREELERLFLALIPLCQPQP
jgi:hypothetical protein